MRRRPYPTGPTTRADSGGGDDDLDSMPAHVRRQFQEMQSKAGEMSGPGHVHGHGDHANGYETGTHCPLKLHLSDPHITDEGRLMVNPPSNPALDFPSYAV